MCQGWRWVKPSTLNIIRSVWLFSCHISQDEGLSTSPVACKLRCVFYLLSLRTFIIVAKNNKLGLKNAVLKSSDND